MVQTASLFSQLLHEVPRNEFARLVNRHQGERHAKGFTCWAQFTAMLFCQLSCALGFSWTLDCERVLAGGVSR